MPRKQVNPKKLTCGAQTRTGGACGRPAGWGTKHPGAGRCKLHGGATPVKHGIYSKIVTREEADRYRAFMASFDMLAPSEWETLLLFRMLEFATGALTDDGEDKTLKQKAFALGVGTEALKGLSLVRVRFKQVIKGDDITIHFDSSMAMDLAAAAGELICRFVEPDRQEDAVRFLKAAIVEKCREREAEAGG
ncbi:MAG: hypothetical protein KKI08_14200 [Armatimonadetes bacterium]|nr:hypothetical protein [Armatimonadota bacterium]